MYFVCSAYAGYAILFERAALFSGHKKTLFRIVSMKTKGLLAYSR